MNWQVFSPIMVLICLYFIPVTFDLEDPRSFIRGLSFIFFLLGISKFSASWKKSSSLQYTSVRTQKSDFIFMILFAFVIGFFFLTVLFQHLNSFFLVDFDYIAISEILNNSLSGKFFTTHHYGEESLANYLSHHFAPSLILLSPFLYISETRLGYAYGLLFFIILSYFLIGLILYKRNIRGSNLYFSIILFATNVFLHRLFFSYHFELLSVFFFLLFFVGKEFNNIYISIFSIVFLLTLKEDIGVYTCCLGVYFLLIRNWRLGFSILIVSVLYFLFVPKFFQDLLGNSANVNWLIDWKKWGDSYLEIFFNIIANPFEIIGLFLSNWKILRAFLFSFSPLILLMPHLMLVSLPIFLIHFTSERIWYNSFYNYYSYSVISFFIIALIYSIIKLQASKFNKYTLAVLFFCISLSLYTSSGDKFFPYSKIEIDTNRVKVVTEVISYIPEHKTVSTQFDLGGFLLRKNPIFPLHEKNLDKDYLLIDKVKGISPYVDKLRIDKMIQTILLKKSYSLYYEKDGIQLYKKN